jgi:hypothetical protein
MAPTRPRHREARQMSGHEGRPAPGSAAPRGHQRRTHRTRCARAARDAADACAVRPGACADPGRATPGRLRPRTGRTHRSPPTGCPRTVAARPDRRAALDGARRLGVRDEVRALLAEVVQRGRCSPAELNAELAEGSDRGTRLPREVLLEISDGVRSVAEADARAIAQRSGLPAPLWNAKIFDRHGRFIAMPDAWFDDVGMAWEIDSREFHLSPADYERTLGRRSAMMAERIVVLHTLPKKLTHRADALTELQRVYAQAARRPAPRCSRSPQLAVRAALSSDRAVRRCRSYDVDARTGPVTSTGERCPAPFRSIGHPAPRAVAPGAGLLLPSGSRARSRSRPAAPRRRCRCRTRRGCSSRRRSSAARRRPRGPPPWAGPGCCGTG